MGEVVCHVSMNDASRSIMQQSGHYLSMMLAAAFSPIATIRRRKRVGISMGMQDIGFSMLYACSYRLPRRSAGT